MVWVGVFLLLATVAVVGSRELWLSRVRELLGIGVGSVPQAEIVWKVDLAPSPLIITVSDGCVLAVCRAAPGETAGDDTGPAATTQVVQLGRDGTAAVLSTMPGTPLALEWHSQETGATGDAADSGSADWWAGTATWAPVGDDPAGPFAETLVWVRGSSSAAAFSTPAVITAAALSGPADVTLVAVFHPAAEQESSAALVAVGAAGEELWSTTTGSDPVHRIAAEQAAGAGSFVAVASPRELMFLDGRGQLLWTRSQRHPIIDIDIQSHGGPVLGVGGELLSYDRRGNLLWRKEVGESVTALDCSGGRIAAASGTLVAVFDEDGLERWNLVCAAPVVGLALGPTGDALGVSVASGQLIVARAPGSSNATAGGN